MSGLSVKGLSVAVVAIMCATGFFVASASPARTVYPDNPTITGSAMIYGGGPVATMDFQPSTDGDWWVSITNMGLKSVDVAAYDVSGPLPDAVFAKLFKFEGSRQLTKNSTLIPVIGGHSYVLDAQAEGKQSGSALITGWFKSTANLGPVAIMSAPQSALVNEPVRFSGNMSYDPDGYIEMWTWLFGDGIVADGPVVTHTYSTAGDYLVRLIVSDDAGATGNTSMIISILPSGPVESPWSSPVQIGVMSNQSCSGLSTAMNSNGQAVVAWNAYQEPAWKVWVRRYAPESGWQTAEPVGECNLGDQPAVGIDDAGNVTVAWIKDNVLLTRRNVIAYGAWDDPVALTNGTGRPSPISLAVNPSGRAVLAWLEQVGTQYDIFASVRAVGNSWSEPAPLESSSDIADSPCAAIDHSGTAVVVFNIYIVQPTPQWDVWANTYVPGQGWKGAVLIENLAYFSSLPIVSMDESSAFATWCYATTTGSNQDNTVYANRCVGGVWQTAIGLDPVTSSSMMYPRVCAWGPANATFLWLAEDDLLGLPGELRASRYMAGVGWTSPEVLNAGSRMWNPRLAVDSSGNAFVGWFQYNSSTAGYDVMAALYSPRGGSSAPQTLGTVTSPKALAVAAGPEDCAIMAWTDYGQGTMWASDHSSADAAPPVAEAGPIVYVPVPLPETVTLDGSASYAASGIVSYVWSWIGGMDNTWMSATGMSPSVPWEWFYYIENYTVTLTITDAEGNTATDTTNVYIAFRLIREDNAFGVQQWYANSDGYLKVMIDNYGMNWVNWTVMDITPSPHIVYESTMYFSGDGVYVSEPFWMSAGQHVQVDYELDGGPPGAYMFVYGFFVPNSSGSGS